MWQAKFARARICATVGVLFFWLDLVPSPARAEFGNVGSGFQVSYSGFAQNASIAPQTDGGFTIVWQDVDGSFQFNIRSRSFDADAVPVGGEVMVNQTSAGTQADASIALVSADVPTLGLMTFPYTIWSSDHPGTPDVFGLLFNNPFPPSEWTLNTTTTGSQYRPDIAGLAGGGFVAVWQSTGHGGVLDPKIFVQAYDASFLPLWSERSPCTTPCASPAVAADASGGFAVSFSSLVFSPPGDRIQIVTYNASGVMTGGGQVPIATDGDAAFSPIVSSDVARLPNGDFILVHDDPDAPLSQIVASRFSATGAPIGTEFPVSVSPIDQLNPEVAVASGGDFLVAWNVDYLPDNVSVRHFDSTGAPAGTEFQVGLSATANSANPAVTSVNSNDFVVVWRDTNGVRAQRVGVITETPTHTPTETPSGPSPTPTATPVPNNCPLSPASGCRTPGKSVLLLKDSSDNTKDKLIWKWIRGASTTDTEFGDPSTSRAYAFCVYDGTGRLLSANVPAHATKWDGLKYKDLTGSADGVQKIILKPSASDTTKSLVKGRGNNLPDTTLGTFSLPLRAQLVNDETSLCFESTYAVGDVIKNDATQFKAKAEN